MSKSEIIHMICQNNFYNLVLSSENEFIMSYMPSTEFCCLYHSDAATWFLLRALSRGTKSWHQRQVVIMSFGVLIYIESLQPSPSIYQQCLFYRIQATLFYCKSHACVQYPLLSLILFCVCQSGSRTSLIAQPFHFSDMASLTHC